MADSIASSQHQEVPVGTSATVTTVVSTDAQDYEVPTVHLKLKKPKSERKVQWSTETVDNESMNKKKSKCCCIYKKPKDFGESSSSEEDSDDECDHCKGHVEKKKHKHENTSEYTPTENGNSIMESSPPNEDAERPHTSDPPPT